MQVHTPEFLQREMGCTAAQLVGWLPGASGGRPVYIEEGRARVAIDSGQLVLEWNTLEPRQIALIRMPRLAVSFRFQGVDEERRRDFMRFFDLSTHRGGG